MTVRGTVEPERDALERRTLATPVAALLSPAVGAALGVLAVVADGQGGGLLLIAAFSTALSWGGAAVVLGAWLRRPVPAAALGALLLVAAVLSYYWLSVVSGLRVRGGDVTHAVLVWSSTAVLAGAALGAGGWFARHGGPAARAAALGTLGGLLAAQGVALWWRTRQVDDVSLVPVLSMVLIAVPAIPVLVFAGGRRLHAIAVFVVVATAGAVAWSAIDGAVR